MKNLCIIFTGTVASTLAGKVINAFSEDGYNVTPVFTEASKFFVPPEVVKNGIEDCKEWEKGHYEKNQPIPHIDLAKANNALLVIASADFISKMANGNCDDLASSLYRAWHREWPVFVAPAMNTRMWNHPVTQAHLEKLKAWGVTIINPVSKILACGDEGMGALADIGDIKSKIDEKFVNIFPLKYYNGIPVGSHLGAFLAERKFGPHTGVDLYAADGEYVYAMNDGIVVSVEDFTGKFDGSDWWNDTRCVLVEHWFGVVCYGEIEERGHLAKGSAVFKGQWIGNVKQVLKHGKERPDIAGHSLSMLHVELYPHGQKKASATYEKDKDILRDPTHYLIESAGPNPKILKQEVKE